MADTSTTLTMTSIWLPVAYAFICASFLATFLLIYKRTILQSQPDLKPWFPPNKARDAYISLLNSDPPAPELHLKTALLRRAMEDVRRLTKLQADKPALQRLQLQGAISENLWKRFKLAEQENMIELQEVIRDADTYRQGWSQFIIPNAAQMVEYEKQRELFAEMTETREREERNQKKREEREEKDIKETEERDKLKKEKERIKAEEELLKAEEKEKEKEKEKDKETGSKKKKQTKKK